ncbi:hypothetical protein KAJ27_00295, partial [bacterium]|nr:hypothetical protein [bacterium]
IVSAYFGWFTGSELLSLGTGIFALGGLVAVLILPWDLYFEAKNILIDQEESIRKGIELSKEDYEYVRKKIPWLLFGCIGLHVLATIVISLVTYFSGRTIGYYFALFFLLSTGFRPVIAFYMHQKSRFAELKKRCRVPREDSIDFSNRIKELEKSLDSMKEESEQEADKGEKRFDKTQLELEQLYQKITESRRFYIEKVDRVCAEFQRSLEHLTQDKELLRGMRALVKMVKETK